MFQNSEPINDFGLPQYQSKYPAQAAAQHFPNRAPHHNVETTRESASSSVLIPWSLRSAEPPWDCRPFHFIASRYFWKSFEIAFRVVCVSLIPVSAFIINVDRAIAPWLSQSVILSANLTAIIGKESLGQIINFYGQFFRALFWWLPIVTAAAALRLDEYPGAWTVLYVVLLFVQASLLDGYSKRNAMACFNSSMLYLLRRDPAVEMPSRLCHDWVVGILFALPAVLLPWPILSKNIANNTVRDIATNLTTAVRGLNQVMLQTPLNRSVHLVRVKYILSRIDTSFVDLKKASEEALYEFFLESTMQRKFRALKSALLKECYQNVSTMFTVALQVRDHANLFETLSAKSFNTKIQPSIDTVCTALERLVCETLPLNGTMKEVASSAWFRALKHAEEKLTVVFEEAREDYYRELLDDEGLDATVDGDVSLHRSDLFVTLSAVYMFSLLQILQAFQKFRSAVENELAAAQRHHTSSWTAKARNLIRSGFEFCVVASFVSFRDRAKNLVFRRNEDDKRILIEAAKTAFAMTASVGFYVIMNATQALLSGPTIIAYVASNPAEAVSFSLPRLTGTILGVVLGFFISTSSETPLQRMTGFAIVTAFCRMTMDVASIGTALGYTNFVALSLLGVSKKTTQSDVFSRIQQNTFAVVIYILVTLFVLPSKPTTMLKEEYASAIKKIVKIYGRVSTLYVDTTKVYADVATVTGALASFAQQRGTSENGSIFMDATIGCVLPISDPAKLLAFPRTEVDAIEKEIRGVEKSITKCAGLMPHAATAPRLAYGVFPTHAASKLIISLRRLVTFLRVLFSSVRAFRERRSIPSASITALLHNVSPCVSDASFEAQHLGNHIADFILKRDVDSIPLIVEMCHTLLSVGTEMRWRKSVIARSIIQGAVRGDSIVLDSTAAFESTMVRSLKDAAKDAEAVHTVAFSAVELGLELKKCFLTAALVTYYREQKLGRLLTESL